VARGYVFRIGGVKDGRFLHKSEHRIDAPSSYKRVSGRHPFIESSWLTSHTVLYPD